MTTDNLPATGDDRSLAAALAAGSPEAADQLVDRFGGPLVRYFSVHLPDPSQAEDMAQETFLRLLGMLGKPNRDRPGGEPPGIGSLYSLIFTIARNLANDVHRARGRAPRLEPLEAPTATGFGLASEQPSLIEMLATTTPDPREQATRAERRRHVEQALRQLPGELREAVVLRHVDGMSGKFIANALGLEEGTVWSRVGRGLTELRRLLGAEQPRIASAPRKGAASDQNARGN